MRRTHLPIAEPCHEDWDRMDPVARGRFCGSCDKQVFDMTAMTEPEARRLLAEHRGSKICVRYACDRQGNLRFRPVRAAAHATVAALALAACTPHQPTPRHEEEMGKIEVVDRDPPPPPAQPDPTPLQTLVQSMVSAPDPEPEVFMGDIAVLEEPCDPPKTPPTDVDPPQDDAETETGPMRPSKPGLVKL